MRKLRILLILSFSLSACKSWGKFWALSVVSISPSDGSRSIATQTTVVITFNQAVQLGSLNLNTENQSCAGNIQFSVTNFQSCIRMKSATLADGGRAVQISSYGFPNGQTVRVKITLGVRSEKDDSLESEYTSAGFSTVAGPCGSNCFVDLGTIPSAANAGAHIFQIESGIHDGKLLYIPGSATNTYLLNTNTMGFIAGPDMTVCGTNNTSSETIKLKLGPHAGKHLTFRVNNSSATCLYDPATNTYTANSPVSLPTNAFQAGFHIYEMTTGPHAGKFYILTGNTGTSSATYDPRTNGFTDATTLPTAANNGTASFAIRTGANAGKRLITFGNGTTDTSLFDPVNLTFAPVVALSPAPIAGFSMHWLESGSAANKAVIFHAGNTATSSLYNPDANSFSATATTLNLISTGSYSFIIPYGTNFGKILLAAGGNFSNTELYTPGAGGVTGPAIPFTITSGSFAFSVETGLYPQTWIIMNTSNYAIYFP